MRRTCSRACCRFTLSRTKRRTTTLRCRAACGWKPASGPTICRPSNRRTRGSRATGRRAWPLGRADREKGFDLSDRGSMPVASGMRAGGRRHHPHPAMARFERRQLLEVPGRRSGCGVGRREDGGIDLVCIRDVTSRGRPGWRTRPRRTASPLTGHLEAARSSTVGHGFVGAAEPGPVRHIRDAAVRIGRLHQHSAEPARVQPDGCRVEGQRPRTCGSRRPWARACRRRSTRRSPGIPASRW